MSLYYWTKVYTGQLKEGQKFEESEKTVIVNILDYINFKQLHKYYNHFSLYEDSLKAIKLTDKLEIHFLELPKIGLEIDKDKLLN